MDEGVCGAVPWLSAVAVEYWWLRFKEWHTYPYLLEGRSILIIGKCQTNSTCKYTQKSVPPRHDSDRLISGTSLAGAHQPLVVYNSVRELSGLVQLESV